MKCKKCKCVCKCVKHKKVVKKYHLATTGKDYWGRI
jgi:hypothetical protein